jgi:putative membrane protein
VEPAFSYDMTYCGPPPDPADLMARWNFDLVLLMALGLVAILGWSLLRDADRMRRTAFVGAWSLAFILFVSPICALTVSLFSARVGHHVALTMLVAPMLAYALPVPKTERFGLAPALALSTIALWGWHTPVAYTAAFAHPAIYWLMQLSLLASFTWLWLGLLRSRAPLAAALVALLGAIQMGLLGALLVFAPSPLYLPHLLTTEVFGLSPLNDQQMAGVIMWVPANLPLMAVLIWRLLALVSPEAKPVPR